jgi:single-stranded-DNA-specific exonuclease
MCHVLCKRLVGVSFDDRQEIISGLWPGEEVFLIREPDNPYDSNAISAHCSSGNVTGLLDRFTAAELAARLDEFGRPVPASVVSVLHNGQANSLLGVEIAFSLPDKEMGST